MFCPVCGYDMRESRVCPACGSKSNEETYEGVVQDEKSKKKRGRRAKVFSFICLGTGIYALAGLNPLSGIAALIFAWLYRKATPDYNKKVDIGRKLGIAGIIVSVALYVLMIIVYIVFYIAYFGLIFHFAFQE